MTSYTSAGGPIPAATASRKRYHDSTSGADRVTDKRQMVSRACDACKQRKAKCSGTLPCFNCTKKDVQCRYESKYARGRPPTPRPTPAYADYLVEGTATPAGAVNVPANNEQIPRAAADPVRQRRQHFQHRRDEEHEQELEQRLEQDQLPPAPSRASPVLEVTEIQGHYVEPTSGLAFLHRAWKRLSRQRPRAVTDGSLTDADERLQLQDQAGDKPFEADGKGSSILPVPDLATSMELTAYYHDVCVATYRFLHRPSVEAWLRQAHQNLDSGLPIGHGMGGMKAAIVLTVLAVAIFHQGKSSSGDSSSGSSSGSGSSRDEVVLTRKSDRLFQAATHLTETATGYPSLDSVQAHLIQVLYLLHTSRLNRAWYVFGHVVQIISALGLHRRASRARPLTSKGVSHDYIDAQCRKRAFWVAYILDAYMGIMFGRPRHYHDENIDQELPDSVNDEDMTATGPGVIRTDCDCAMDSLIFHARYAIFLDYWLLLGIFSHKAELLTQFRIGRIVGRISQNVYAINQDLGDSLIEIVQGIRADIDNWTASLPTILCSVNHSSLVYPFRRQATTMRLARYHAIIHLTRPFLLRQIGSHRAQPLAVTAAVSDCISAARDVLGIIDMLAGDGTLFYAFWWTHYVAFCSLAVVYVWEIQRNSLGRGDCVQNDTNNQRSLHNSTDGLFQLAEKCQSQLAKATNHNSPSRRYSIILEELRSEALFRSSRRDQQQPSLPIQLGMLTEGHNQVNETSMNFTNAVAGNAHTGIGRSSGNPATMHTPNSSLSVPYEGWQMIDWLDIDSLVRFCTICFFAKKAVSDLYLLGAWPVHRDCGIA